MSWIKFVLIAVILLAVLVLGVEFSTLHADPVTWITVDTEAGTGGVIVLSDTTVAGVIRLYRVVEQ